MRESVQEFSEAKNESLEKFLGEFLEDYLKKKNLWIIVLFMLRFSCRNWRNIFKYFL